MNEKIVEVVTSHFLRSSDFNGIQVWNLLSELNKDWNGVKPVIRELVNNDVIAIIDEKTDLNPNIIRLGFESKESQIEKTKLDNPGYMCIYPSKSTLIEVVNKDEYSGLPFKLHLALGNAQLDYTSFDLSVLEYYRNDPRYRYENDDINGQICYDSEEIPEGDRILLETFGFSYDDEINRAVAVFYRYLSRLTPEHQGVWKVKEKEIKFNLHPDYFRNSIEGNFGIKIPLCSAFVKELYIINEMSKAMDRPPLFLQDFGKYGNDRPKKFNFLIRPTLDEFNNFVLLLDKMISDNISKDFFLNDIELETETVRKDGKTLVTQKGTLLLLDEWIRNSFRLEDWGKWDEAIKTLKKIRKLRQQPAHSIKEDEFDQKYFKEQRNLLIAAYKSIRLIRLIFTLHPLVEAANVDIPHHLYEGKIWNI